MIFSFSRFLTGGYAVHTSYRIILAIPITPTRKTASIAVTIKIDRPTVLKTKMKQTTQFTAIIERERDGYVSLCPELDIASQGDTIEEARNNLIEALELFFETADPSEIQQRLHTEVFVTRLEINIG